MEFDQSGYDGGTVGTGTSWVEVDNLEGLVVLSSLVPIKISLETQLNARNGTKWKRPNDQVLISVEVLRSTWTATREKKSHTEYWNANHKPLRTLKSNNNYYKKNLMQNNKLNDSYIHYPHKILNSY